MYDLLIKNGTVVDGTGAPRRHADVAIANGKIVDVGKISESATRVIDASDLVVAPGFVDPHTHYDAQICWDRPLTSASWHGVTTVVMGNCGVGIAPCKPEVRDIAAWDLVNVEGIPFDALAQGITWDWVSFPEYMDAAQRRGLGINLAFLAPLTPFRHFVMGEESMDRAATAAETAQIQTLLREAMAAGAYGWTTTTILQHVGYKGRPLACRQASREELTAYAHVLRDLGKGVIETTLTKSAGILADDEYELLDLLLTESGRPVTWLAVVDCEHRPEGAQESLRKAEPLIKRGGIPQVNCLPMSNEFNLHNPFLFGSHPSWKPAFNQPAEEQMRVYRDPSFRQAFRQELANPRIFSGNWNLVEVRDVHNPALKSLEGKTVVEIARERGKDPLDTFFDIALEDQLHTEYVIALFNVHEDRVAKLITDPRGMIGLSDGGAHVDMHDNAGYCTYLLGTWVRDKQIMSLERAIQRVTAEPAAFFGIRDRGVLAAGKAADLVIFDFNTIGPKTSPIRHQEWRRDLPAGGRRLVWPADQGVQYTIVNGAVLYAQQRYTGTLPGQVLRS
jgi:N-acyl-D-aspartate/D-glutamate deacylase